MQPDIATELSSKLDEIISRLARLEASLPPLLSAATTVSPTAAGIILGVSHHTIRTWLRSGVLPGRQLPHNGRWRIERAELAKLSPEAMAAGRKASGLAYREGL